MLSTDAPPPFLLGNGPLFHAFEKALKDPELAMVGVSICLWWKAAFQWHPTFEPEDRLRRVTSDEEAEWFRMYGDEAYYRDRVEAAIPFTQLQKIVASCRESKSFVPLKFLPLEELERASLVGLFLRRVCGPHMLWHNRSPWEDFQCAVEGNEEALKRLVMIDRLVLEAPVIQSRWGAGLATDKLLCDRVAYADLHRIEDRLDHEHRRVSGKPRLSRPKRVSLKLRFAAHLQLWAQRHDQRLMPRHITAIFNAMHTEFREPADEKDDLPIGESLRVELSRIRSEMKKDSCTG